MGLKQKFFLAIKTIKTVKLMVSWWFKRLAMKNT